MNTYGELMHIEQTGGDEEMIDIHDDRPYQATNLICEAIIVNGKEIMIDLDIHYGAFKTKDHALKIANNTEFTFWVEKRTNRYPEPVIIGKCSLTGVEYYIGDKDIVFKKLKEERKSRMGTPIDCSTQEGKEKAMRVLKSMDESYMISESDMEECDIGLKDLMDHWESGYLLQNVAYGTVNIYGC